jgi:catechol 2,3-dioxygenase-like lactoylglutathione lyase family enzyme
LASTITKVDTVGIPSQDWQRSRRFYVETLGLRPDEHSYAEFWVGDTCFAIWEPERFGMEFAPTTNGIALLHVDDVSAARADLEEKGVEFVGETADTGVCHMATFVDPDGNQLVLHNRYKPYES